MSTYQSHLGYAQPDICAYLKGPINTGKVKAIYLTGSRNPKSSKPHRKDSDWDFLALVEKRTSFASPRGFRNKPLALDMGVGVDGEVSAAFLETLTEIWPNDTTGDWSCLKS